MTFDDPVEIEFQPFVPPRIRKELVSRLNYVSKIIVSEHDDGRTRKANGLTLNRRPGQMAPVEPVDDIAASVTVIMHVQWAAQKLEEGASETDRPPMQFVIVCEGKNAKGARKRSQFQYTYHAELEDPDNEEELSPEQESTNRLVDAWERLATCAIDEKQEAHARLLEVVQQNTASASAGSQLLANAIPLFLSGNQAILQAKYMEYSTDHARAESKANADKFSTTVQGLAPFAMVLLMQVMSKMGMDPTPVVSMMAGAMGGQGGEPEDAGPAHAAAQPSAQPAAQPQPPGGAYAYAVHTDGTVDPPEAPPPTDAGPDGSEHRLAAIAHAFGNSLTPVQRRDMGKILTRKQLAAFDDLFCSEDDAAARQCYQVVVATCMAKLGELQALLDPEQRQALQMFMAAAGRPAQA